MLEKPYPNGGNTKLPDDPRKALSEIASYLRTARTDNDGRHYEPRGPEGLGREHVGYWQPPEWLDGLAEIATEADRIAHAVEART
jgi:hypothetical protein